MEISISELTDNKEEFFNEAMSLLDKIKALQKEDNAKKATEIIKELCLFSKKEKPENLLSFQKILSKESLNLLERINKIQFSDSEIKKILKESFISKILVCS